MARLATQLDKKSLENIIRVFEASDIDKPIWIDDKTINEVVFADEFLKNHPMRCLHGLLYDIEGYVSDDKTKSNIYKEIKNYVSTGVDKKIENLLKVIKISCQVDDFPVDTDKIHFNNGTYSISEGFSEHKEWTLNRLPVAYNPDASEPKRWLKFLNELLDKDDIPTLQEFMGYCFIPCTKAQTMLLIIGKGGEGKSRIGVVLRHILGENMNTGSIKKLETNRFCPADQEGKLLLLDDDMSIEGLPSTNVIKTIVTAEGKMDLEKKGQQSYQGLIYARLIGLGNGALKALYDRSNGFYRRQLILTTKDKPADRVDDKNLSQKLIAESEGIINWCLDGLHRLVENGFEFTLSEKAKRNKSEVIKDNNNIVEFLNSDGYIAFDPKGTATSKDLYKIYTDFCYDNAIKPIISAVTFFKYMNENAESLKINPTKNLKGEYGKIVRGFKGIKIIAHQFNCPTEQIELENDEEILKSIFEA
ncbi:DNA primase [bacterium]|nr:DNA primase [bacterium]